LAVVVVEHFIFDADASPGLLRFGAAPIRELFSALRLMPGITVSERDEFDPIAKCGVSGSQASGAEIAVVRMRAESNDAHGFTLGA
jgi:hypothetical protein